MDQDLSSYRKVYAKEKLSKSSVPFDPMELFHQWFQEAKRVEREAEINAMSLSTIGQDGAPETRIVLLKGYGISGFLFYTNYQSRKGKAITQDPRVCISFFWPGLQRQVIIKGTAARLPEKRSDEYFAQRPRSNQIGAWASEQSRVIPSRAYLEQKFEFWKNHFETHPLKRPDFWGGYRVQPYEMEFWQGRPNRLHDRLYYKFNGKKWQLERRSP